MTNLATLSLYDTQLEVPDGAPFDSVVYLALWEGGFEYLLSLIAHALATAIVVTAHPTGRFTPNGTVRHNNYQS